MLARRVKSDSPEPALVEPLMGQMEATDGHENAVKQEDRAVQVLS